MACCQKETRPRRLTIVTGSHDGAYSAFAWRYQAILSRDDVILDVRTTAGSIENQDLLADNENSDSLAIMQGSTVGTGDRDEYESLASLHLHDQVVKQRNQCDSAPRHAA
jgi:uncharacterized protein